jgi:hypothetical protein
LDGSVTQALLACDLVLNVEYLLVMSLLLLLLALSVAIPSPIPATPLFALILLLQPFAVIIV